MVLKSAFLFPGQGSQSVGMLGGLAEAHEVVIETFGEASQALGYDLWGIVSGGPEARLDKTEVTQPAMLAADIATWRVWRTLGGPTADCLAGHSLGEYAALVAANALDFGDAVRLVAERGRLMQEATPEGTGAMAAILGLADPIVQRICDDAAEGQVVSCANFNSPGQVVIAGHAEAVERACEGARAAGAKRALRLPVSVPSHCRLMKPAADGLAALLSEVEIRPPGMPVFHNVDARPHDEPGQIRDALAAQLWQPVLWTATVQLMASMGVSRLAECGPGKVLAGLCRRIARELECTALTDGEALRDALAKWSKP